MSTTPASTKARPSLHPEFVKNLVRTFEDPDEHGVHLLFNEWWACAPEETIQAYLEGIRATPGAEPFLGERFLAPQTTLEELGAMPEGSVGKGYFDFLTRNGLEKNLATNYGQLHEFMCASGHLDRMPDELKYAIIRGFQIHDLLHVLTGYTPSGLDELALQAFCLAQLQFPYFGMWMSTTTTRMTFLEPRGIVPTMDAISAGWRLGRETPNLQFERWEDRFEEPLADVRSRYRLRGDPSAA